MAIMMLLMCWTVLSVRRLQEVNLRVLRRQQLPADN